MLAVVTGQWLPNWSRGFARVQGAELLALGLERVVADLAAAELVSANRETERPLFDGAEASVTFVRSALGPNARPGLEIVRLAETAERRGSSLVRTRAPFAPLSSPLRLGDEPQFGDPVALVRPPYAVTFAYAGVDRVWRGAWRDAAELPRAVRIMVRDARTGRALAASTATLIHVELPADCVNPTTDRECRRPRSGVQPTPPASNP
jgi:general secretion pathway protein J